MSALRTPHRCAGLALLLAALLAIAGYAGAREAAREAVSAAALAGIDPATLCMPGSGSTDEGAPDHHGGHAHGGCLAACAGLHLADRPRAPTLLERVASRDVAARAAAACGHHGAPRVAPWPRGPPRAA